MKFNLKSFAEKNNNLLWAVIIVMLLFLFFIWIITLNKYFFHVTINTKNTPQIIFINVSQYEQDMINEHLISILDEKMLYGIKEIIFINDTNKSIFGKVSKRDPNEPFEDEVYRWGDYRSDLTGATIRIQTDIRTERFEYLEMAKIEEMRPTLCHEIWHHWINTASFLLSDKGDMEHYVMDKIDLYNSCYHPAENTTRRCLTTLCVAPDVPCFTYEISNCTGFENDCLSTGNNYVCQLSNFTDIITGNFIYSNCICVRYNFMFKRWTW